MTSTSSETDIFTTPQTSPSPIATCQPPSHLSVQPGFLDLDFDESRFSFPNKARGICCSAKSVCYSNRHWPEQPEHKYLFDQASGTWEKLEPEFKRIWNKTWKRSRTVAIWRAELRLAGAHHPNERRIILRPSIWIMTTDKAIGNSTVWKKLQAKVGELGLNSNQYASIFAEGGTSLANGPASVPLERLNLARGIEFSRGVTLYTHATWGTASKPYECGEICLTTIVKNGRIVYQEVSRIGGLLVINASLLVGVTSGHTILLYFLQNPEEMAPMDEDDLQSSSRGSDPESCSEDQDGQESNDECEIVENDINSRGPISDLGYVDLGKVNHWVPITPSGTINFIQQAEVELLVETPYAKLTNLSTGPIPADFALVPRQAFGAPLGQNDNIYYFNGRKSVSSIFPDSRVSASGQEILVLLGSGIEGSAGFLQPTKLPFSIGRTTIWARKIHLTAPLGRGTSGSWVVERDSGSLCGSIIAVVEHQPYALMVTAQSLFSDIIQYSRDIGLVTLGLPAQNLEGEGEALVSNDQGYEVGLRSVGKEDNIVSLSVKSIKTMGKSITPAEDPEISPQTMAQDPITTIPSQSPASIASNCSSMASSSRSPSSTESSVLSTWIFSAENNVLAKVAFRGSNFKFTTFLSLETEMLKTYPAEGYLRFSDTFRSDSTLAGCGSVFDLPRHMLALNIG